MLKLILSFIAFLIFSFSFSQKRLLKGYVTDSLQQPLEFVNIMAQSLNNDSPFVFAVTDSQGYFEMRLKNQTAYQLTVSFMGYKPYIFKVDSVQVPQLKTIILKPNNQSLDEIVISYKTPVKITQDSIVYTVKYFVKGNENKLKAVLNKLPGVKVDKNGQITVMGNRITKVMVEGKDFFGGNSKLAVENIPADAVKSVQVLKDYNRVGFMKGLTDEQKTVINIKLKEGKKRFVFGDITSGGNTDKSYLAKANLFYFSPKTNLNYIGNTNDYGEASLTVQDIMRLNDKDVFFIPGISHGDNNLNLYSFLPKNNFIHKKILFNAFQWQQDFNKKWQFGTYTILANETNDYQKEINNRFLIPPYINQYVGEIENTQNKNILSQVKIIYEPDSNQYIKLQMSFRKFNQNLEEKTLTQTDLNTNTLSYSEDNKQINYFESFSYYKKFSKRHIIRFFSNYQFNQWIPNENWLSDKIFLADYISWTQSNNYTLWQQKSLRQHQFNNLFKYYFKINNHHHLYFSLGNMFTYADFNNHLSQNLNETIVQMPDFYNDYRQKNNDLYLGLQYRFKIGKHMFTPGLYLHHLWWKNSYKSIEKETILLLPEINYEGKILRGDISLKYKMNTNLPSTEMFANNKILKSYNQVFLGNPYLSYELYHQLSLHYSYFSFTKHFMFFIHLDLKKYQANLKQKQTVLDANYYMTPEIYYQPDQNWAIIINMNKEWKFFSLEYQPFFSFGKSYDFINDQSLKNNNINFSNLLSVTTDYTKLPEVEIGFSWNYMLTDNNLEKMTYQEVKPFLNTKITYKSITFKSEYKLQYLKQEKNFNRSNNLWNLSLLLKKEDKPFGVELEIKNLLNQKYIHQYNVLSYLNVDQIRFIQPRVWMLKLHYKL